MRRLRLFVEYDGGGFQGWQLQPEARSVQGVLEQAIACVTRRPARVIGAGRTDAGVHARGQAAHFDSETRLAALDLRRAINAVLPDDVSVTDLHEVPSTFDARRDAISKTYLYRILNRAAPSPLRRGRTWHLRSRLDSGTMRQAAACLQGDHDFAAFRGAPGGAETGERTRRTLDRLEVSRQGDEVRVLAEGRSFLRYMVRNLTGTLAEVGQGRRPAAEVEAILASGDRARAGATAPAHGLCLERVVYPDAPGNPE